MRRRLLLMIKLLRHLWILDLDMIHFTSAAPSPRLVLVITAGIRI